ncbi:MAG: hypothetical protein R2794_04400 [Chitinophagales bacterium]
MPDASGIYLESMNRIWMRPVRKEQDNRASKQGPLLTKYLPDAIATTLAVLSIEAKDPVSEKSLHPGPKGL